MSFRTYQSLFLIVVSVFSVVLSEKYRLCLVDGKGEYKRSARYCPKLDATDSQVECIIALDRLDCLRRIHKGTADFAVFTPEDLVAAANSQMDILVTNELRYFKEHQFEYEVVAVVSNHANIKSKHDLKNKKYCHPGYGYEADWTRILSNYFEASVVTPQCDSDLTITENRIKASSDFFGKACKAGPWINDPILDRKMKDKYPNLCALCDVQDKCSMQDKYWGRRGSLFCLTDGAGEVSWARLDDVQQHFGLTPGGQEDNPDNFSFLCPDNSLMPVNSSNPCVWVVKPWSVVASTGNKAAEIQKLISTLDHKERNTWKSSLLNLLEITYLNIVTLESPHSIEMYFHNAKGFLNANSFSGCHPPRTIRICTTSNIETAKCSWLRESAAVYGIEPDLDCLKADNTTHCMMALNDNAADIVMVSSDMVHKASKKYKLKTLFYETVPDTEKYIVVPVTRKDTTFKDLADMKGAKACFPVYDGVAWNTVKQTLHKEKLIGQCSRDKDVADFFGPSCVPNIPKTEEESLWKNCQSDFDGDFGALHCLSSGVGDVAFVSRNSIQKFVATQNVNSPGYREKLDNFNVICKGQNSSCHLSWAPVSQGMVRRNSTDMWLKDTFNVFMQLDGLFGKYYKDITSSFTMFGRYDGVSDVLFHDVTAKLREVPTIKNTDQMDLPYNQILEKEVICYSSSAHNVISFSFIISLFILQLFI
ncbi:transferrin 3 isoform X1 [Rhynchophorus ferrugineus]|uniref:transferrin 3 isoform X1 n=1 Tax=Rhynchophorus ferrugineus TaxID=354439 RepID=UPI003FCCC856